jgi:hypothetical protein
MSVSTVPNRFANTPGNRPDAEKYMQNWDWMFAQLLGDHLLNGGMEEWDDLTSYTNPSGGILPLKGWLLEKGESTTKDTGSYAMKVAISGAGSSDSYIRFKQHVADYAKFAGLTALFNVRVQCSTASKVRLSIDDGVTSVQYSSYHSGGGAYETLQVALAASASLTKMVVKVEITSDFTGTGASSTFIDSAFLVVVPDSIDAVAKAALGFAAVNKRLLDPVRLFTYRRPVLKWVSTTTVDVENNTPVEHETEIIFPDGESRRVTENTGSTTKYRRFDITAAAVFLTGTEDSGVRSGISEANNTWYAIYAVKSQVDTTKFVLAGDTTLPLRANVATLNGRYGTNGWVYLGLIRNGDNGAATGDILNFVQTGNFTYFRAGSYYGTRLINASAASASWSYAAGTGAAAVPNQITQVVLGAFWNHTTAARNDLSDSAAAIFFAQVGNDSKEMLLRVTVPITGGILMNNSGGGNSTLVAALSGFWDPALGVGSNPLI